MANYRAIAATGTALAGLIRDRYPRDDFGTGLEIVLYQTRDFESPMQDGFSIYLFRIAVNGAVRDRHFMSTTWAQDVERQLRMLGWVMRLMEDTSVLSAGHLNHYLVETDTFAPNEGLEVVCDPLSLTDYLTLWDRLRPRLPASATYVIRVVLIDSDVPVTDAPLVQTRTFDMAEESA